MNLIFGTFNFALHIDKYLGEVISSFGVWSYAIVCIIIFLETGVVLAPFLPGDSLLFAAGAFAALGSFNVVLLALLLWIAAVLGDTVNYWIGYLFGQKLIDNPKVPINAEHIQKTHQFFAKHGGKSIVLARFVPIVRTTIPFVAGIGKMNYKKFIEYNIIGAFLWVFGFTFLGYFFGNIPIVQKNFSLVILAIVGFSVIPVIFQILKVKLTKPSQKT